MFALSLAVTSIFNQITIIYLKSIARLHKNTYFKAKGFFFYMETLICFHYLKYLFIIHIFLWCRPSVSLLSLHETTPQKINPFPAMFYESPEERFKSSMVSYYAFLLTKMQKRIIFEIRLQRSCTILIHFKKVWLFSIVFLLVTLFGHSWYKRHLMPLQLTTSWNLIYQFICA